MVVADAVPSVEAAVLWTRGTFGRFGTLRGAALNDWVAEVRARLTELQITLSVRIAKGTHRRACDLQGLTAEVDVRWQCGVDTWRDLSRTHTRPLREWETKQTSIGVIQLGKTLVSPWPNWDRRAALATAKTRAIYSRSSRRLRGDILCGRWGWRKPATGAWALWTDSQPIKLQFRGPPCHMVLVRDAFSQVKMFEMPLTAAGPKNFKIGPSRF